MRDVYIIKVYLDSGQTILGCLGSLDWKVNKAGRLTSFEGIGVTYDDFLYLKRSHPNLEYLRVELLPLEKVDTFTVVDVMQLSDQEPSN